MGERADAAAELYRVFRRRQDRVDGIAVSLSPAKAPFKIDHMQPVEALVLEGFRLGAGTVVEDGRLVHVARA
jgi:hypothetical protein